jgi:hypothetical protein
MPRFIFRLVFLCVLTTSAQEPGRSYPVSIKELPPEAIPIGTCQEDLSGPLFVIKNGKEETHLTDKQLGEYVRVRLSQGYSVSLYPQVSGNIFAIATCESSKR